MTVIVGFEKSRGKIGGALELGLGEMFGVLSELGLAVEVSIDV